MVNLPLLFLGLLLDWRLSAGDQVPGTVSRPRSSVGLLPAVLLGMRDGWSSCEPE